jgi:hypothetical protein
MAGHHRNRHSRYRSRMGLNVALGATAGLAAAALVPLAAIAAIIAGGAIGGASLNNAINSVGAQSEAGLNMLNQATAPGMGVPGASRDPIFQPTPAAAAVPRGTGASQAGLAGGGISGPGGPKSDMIPAMLSDGEHVFTAADVDAMGGQSGVYSFRKALHAAKGGAVRKLEDMRTAGAMPAAAGNTSPVGGSTISSFIDMGGEFINGIIDQAASAAATAASGAAMAGSFGAAGPVGGQAAGAAAGTAIGLGTDAAKRGVSFGFDLLGIGVDSILEQLTPFGQPRFLNQDVSGFVPQQQITGALGNLMGGGAEQAMGLDPNTTQHGTTGQPPGPIDSLDGQPGAANPAADDR